MKKAAILATVLAAALCVAPLAACGEDNGEVEIDGKPFNMADYATEIPESMTIHSGSHQEIPEFKSVRTLDVQFDSFGMDSSISSKLEVAKEFGKNENDGKYGLFNLKSGQSAKEWYSSISAVSYSSPFIVLENAGSTSDGEGLNSYRLAYPTGELVTSATFGSQYFQTSTEDYYVDNTHYTCYCVTYQTEAGEETARIAYEKGAWKKMTEADLHPQQTSDSYQVGDSLGVAKTPLVEVNGDEEDYPDYIYKDYSYSREGNSSAYTYTLYKGDEKLDSMVVFGQQILGVIGKYFYYYEARPVSADAVSGYNCEMSGSYGSSSYGSVEKYDMILHRFDITNSENEVVDTDYIFSASGALYNHSTNDFDRLVVSAYRKVDGVAVISGSAPVYSLILDDDACVSFNLTGKSISPTFYKLSDDRYFTGNVSRSVILDGECNTVAILPSYNVSVWEEQSLILCNNSNEYFAVDYDGKVAIAGMGSTWGIGICGNGIVATNQNSERAVFSKSAPNGKTIDEIIGDYSFVSGGAVLYTCSSVDDAWNISFYNAIGTKVGDFKARSTEPFQSSTPVTCGGKYYYSALDENNKQVTLLFE